MNQHFKKKYKITGTPSLMQHKSIKVADVRCISLKVYLNRINLTQYEKYK